jgi:hypothetical protein
MAAESTAYPARLEIAYPGKMDRLSTFFRIFWAIPILIILALLTASTFGGDNTVNEAGARLSTNSSGGAGIVGGLFAATALMILFRQRYPRWWFDFNLELNRFSTRVSAYLLLLTDKYPSTVDKQTVTLDIDYPDVERDLNRWLPLVKWLLAIPHYFVLLFLVLGALLATIAAWFAILFTGRYPKDLFDFVVGVERWSLRVTAYALLLTTDKYPPFSLK